MKKLIFVNQKGGSGKSILSYNFAHYLAGMGERVLFVDGDEQGSSSKSLAEFAVPGMAASALFGMPDFALPAITPKLHSITLLRGHPNLRLVEKSNLDDGELVIRLRANLASIADRFDFCVIDTAGANSRVANALLIASDYAIMPCRIDPYSIDVAAEVLKRVLFIQQHFNDDLMSFGILPNEVDASSGSQQHWIAQLKSAYPALVMPISVPKRSAYREACAAGVPVWRLRKENADGSEGGIKTSANIAGREVREVFKLIKNRMEQS